MCQRWRRRGVVLHRTDDARHGPYRFQRVTTHRRLAGQHHRVRPVQYRIGDVGGLRTSGPGVLDHRLEHLGGHDHRLGVLAGDLNGPLLHQWHFLQRQFHPEITPGDHDRVKGPHYRFEGVDGFGLLQFGDHRNPATDPVHDRMDQLDVGRRAHKRQGDQVHAQVQCELQIGNVLLGQRRNRDCHARHRQPFVVADGSALGDGAHHVGSVDVLNDQSDLAVVDQQSVTGSSVARQLLVGGGDPIVGAFALLDGDANRLAVGPERFSVGESAQADLRSLQVGQYSDGTAGGFRGATYPPIGGLVVGIVAVAEVQAGDIHSRLDQGFHHVVGAGGRAEGTDDLAAPRHEGSIAASRFGQGA